MNILYIACSCSPYHGSEDKIGWNVPVESAKSNRVFVITRESQREYIERFLKQSPLENIAFYYVDLPKYLYRLARKFSYTILLRAWNKRALKTAKGICRSENIDVIHQITPVEFRSIGDYWKIPDISFVAGPIAGGQDIPHALRAYANKHKMAEGLRRAVNNCFRFGYRVSRKLQKCDYILYANSETKAYLSKTVKDRAKEAVYTDVSVAEEEIIQQPRVDKKHGDKCRFIVAGRLVYLKGHSFLLDALAALPEELEYECRIVGGGAEINRLKEQCAAQGLSQKLSFAGGIPYTEIGNEYQNADVLIMPSLREATGSVALEAMANGLPVVTIDKFGASKIVDAETGWLYGGNTKAEYIKNLRDIIEFCIRNPAEVSRRGMNALNRAKNYTWKERGAYYQRIYERLTGKDS